MKNITKDNKGITLIALIITIIIMLILVSVTTYTGIDTYKYSQVNKFVAQMQLLQTKIDDLVSTKTDEELNSMGFQELTTEQQNIINSAFNNGEISTNVATGYKVFTKDNILNILDVEDVHNDIMINFTTREIVDVVGVEYNGVTYYTQYKLPGGQSIINNTTVLVRDLSYDLDLMVVGLNATVTVNNIKVTNATLSYKETNSNYWTNIINYTEAGNEYICNISKSGNYTFRLLDNVNSDNYKDIEINIKTTNKPKTDILIKEYNYALTSENWAYTQKDSINYLWIPRFVYKTNAETNTIDFKFVKGNSNIATDNTYVDDTWSIHEKFTTDDLELTGIWVSVSEEEMEQTGLNMITVLNDDSRKVLIEI